MTQRCIDVMGVQVQAHTMPSLLALLECLISSSGCRTAYAVNAHSMAMVYRDRHYMDVLNRADVVYADGASILLAARLLGTNLPARLTTTDVWPELCRIAQQKGYRFFLLGGEPGLVEETRDKTLAQFPGLQIAGTHHGYFDLDDDRIISIINDAEPHVLWVGMGEPRQAFWADDVQSRLKAGVLVTCGGMYKIISGRLKRAPACWRQCGGEWLYRMTCEPATIKRYVADLPVLLASVLTQRLLRK